jgi:hypothetical protein
MFQQVNGCNIFVNCVDSCCIKEENKAKSARSNKSVQTDGGASFYASDARDSDVDSVDGASYDRTSEKIVHASVKSKSGLLDYCFVILFKFAFAMY